MSTAYIALGSNQGDRHREIIRAITLMTRHELKVYSVSPFIETQPVGFASDFPFINGTVAVHTKSSPQELLTLLKMIESAMGRKKKSHDGIYSDRLIDLDILQAKLNVQGYINIYFDPKSEELYIDREFLQKDLTELMNH